YFRLQTDARKDARPGTTCFHSGQRPAFDDERRAVVIPDREAAAAFSAIWQKRSLGQRSVSVYRQNRRRSLLRQNTTNGSCESRSRSQIPAHRFSTRGKAAGRRLGKL